MGDLHSVPGTSRRTLTIQAVVTSILLSLLFLVVYSGTNWLTSLRTDVGTWRYDWERWIPFVPLMVLPYMSIDLFFVSAPLLMRSREEMRIFAQRISLAIVVAGACFLLFPLRLAVERPKLEGWLGEMFGWFFTMDKPFNLCPSLHIALRTILADTYGRHARGLWNVASHLWFSLVGVSTLLTYQHHFVDVVGGFILATVCFYVIPTVTQPRRVIPNPRIGMYYAMAALVLSLLVGSALPWSAWLIWPAVASFIVTAAYFGWGPGVYRKYDGTVALSTRLVLAPVIIGQYLSWRYYRRECRAWDQVAPNLWIGRWLTESEASAALRQGVRAVLDVTAEFSAPTSFRNASYLNVPILDLTAPTSEQLAECVQFITDQSRQGIVYVHCKAGYSRSGAVVGSYLLFSGRATNADDAIAQLRRARPTIVIRPEAEAAIRAFAAAHASP